MGVIEWEGERGKRNIQEICMIEGSKDNIFWSILFETQSLKGPVSSYSCYFAISNDSLSSYLSPLTQTQVSSTRSHPPPTPPHYIIVSTATITVLTHKPLRQSDYVEIMPMISCTQALSQAFTESSKAQSKTRCPDMPRHLAAIFAHMAKLAQSMWQKQRILLCTFCSQLSTINQNRVTAALSCYTAKCTVGRLKEKYVHPYYPPHTIFIT